MNNVVKNKDVRSCLQVGRVLFGPIEEKTLKPPIPHKNY